MTISGHGRITLLMTVTVLILFCPGCGSEERLRNGTYIKAADSRGFGLGFGEFTVRNGMITLKDESTGALLEFAYAIEGDEIIFSFMEGKAVYFARNGRIYTIGDADYIRK